MRIIETKVYEIHEHPNKDLCFEWIRNNWHDLNYYSSEELVDSLKELQSYIGGNLSYSISTVPDRGEHITLEGYDPEMLSSLNAEDYPLTGIFWDFEVIKGLQEGNMNQVLGTLHDETEYCYSDKGLTEMCEQNEYEFDESGAAYSL
tara:strand:- start:9050 stop:9490 length:441 start_codon:yes stop_codon:yes gene_type:complete